MDYTQALQKLGKRDSRKLENNTYLQKREEGEIAVKLYNTDIIIMQESGVNVLFTGNYMTITTKDRLNKYSGVNVNQKDYIWYIDGVEFYEGIKVKDGVVIQ